MCNYNRTIMLQMKSFWRNGLFLLKTHSLYLAFTEGLKTSIFYLLALRNIRQATSPHLLYRSGTAHHTDHSKQESGKNTKSIFITKIEQPIAENSVSVQFEFANSTFHFMWIFIFNPPLSKLIKQKRKQIGSRLFFSKR